MAPNKVWCEAFPAIGDAPVVDHRAGHSGPDDPGPCGREPDNGSIDHSPELAGAGRGRCHEDLQRSIGWQREHPSAEPPSARAAATTARADKGFGRKTLVVPRNGEGSTVEAATPDTAVGKTNADPHHANRSAVDSGLDILLAMGIDLERHVDQKAVRIHVQGGDDPYGVLALVQKCVDCQGGGQGSF